MLYSWNGLNNNSKLSQKNLRYRKLQKELYIWFLRDLGFREIATLLNSKFSALIPEFYNLENKFLRFSIIVYIMHTIKTRIAPVFYRMRALYYPPSLPRCQNLSLMITYHSMLVLRPCFRLYHSCGRYVAMVPDLELTTR